MNAVFFFKFINHGTWSIATPIIEIQGIMLSLLPITKKENQKDEDESTDNDETYFILFVWTHYSYLRLVVTFIYCDHTTYHESSLLIPTSKKKKYPLSKSHKEEDEEKSLLIGQYHICKSFITLHLIKLLSFFLKEELCIEKHSVFYILLSFFSLS